MARRDSSYASFVFFQAEDGIRDIGVTGVQTCALPISVRDDLRLYLVQTAEKGLAWLNLIADGRAGHGSFRNDEIGRASCRERSVDLGGRRIIKKKKH